MKKQILSLTLAIIASIILAGCASVGTEMNMTQMQAIEKGQTTRSELVAEFGSPSSVGINEKGTFAFWVYSESKSSARNFIPIVNAFSQKYNNRVQQLTAYFDDDGVVTDFVFNESNTPIKGGIL